MNKVLLIGHLGKDPEMRHFENGGKVGKFTLATNENYTNRAGERVKATEWHEIEVWEKQAELAEKWLKKGKKILVEGKLKTEAWKDKDGNDRSKKIIRCTSFEMLDSLESGGQNQNTASDSAPSAEGGFTPVSEEFAASTGGEDLPF